MKQVQSGQTLLPIEYHLHGTPIGRQFLHILQLWRVLGLPEQEAAHRVLVGQGHQQLLGLFPRPDVFALELWQNQVLRPDLRDHLAYLHDAIPSLIPLRCSAILSPIGARCATCDVSRE